MGASEDTPIPDVPDNESAVAQGQEDLLRVEMQRMALRMTELEGRVKKMEDIIGNGNFAGALRQFRRLRTFLKVWLAEG